MRFLRKPFPVARADTITRRNIRKFEELWAEEHDKAPTPEQFLNYIMPGQSANRYGDRHLQRDSELMTKVVLAPKGS